jgi:hypothetical protein
LIDMYLEVTRWPGLNVLWLVVEILNVVERVRK